MFILITGIDIRLKEIWTFLKYYSVILNSSPRNHRCGLYTSADVPAVHDTVKTERGVLLTEPRLHRHLDLKVRQEVLSSQMFLQFREVTKDRRTEQANNVFLICAGALKHQERNKQHRHCAVGIVRNNRQSSCESCPDCTVWFSFTERVCTSCPRTEGLSLNVARLIALKRESLEEYYIILWRTDCD
jgi:hypothetical protein